MATSGIYIYGKKTNTTTTSLYRYESDGLKFNINSNAIIEDLETYLTTGGVERKYDVKTGNLVSTTEGKTLLVASFSGQMYVKNAGDKNIKVKLALPQGKDTMSDDIQYQYVKITCEDKYIDYAVGTSSARLLKPYYYFVKSVNWLSQATLELELELDILNTAEATNIYTYSSATTTYPKRNVDYYKLSPKTTVHREHKDRFYTTEITTGYTYSNIPASFSLNKNIYLKKPTVSSASNWQAVNSIGRFMKISRNDLSILYESNFTGAVLISKTSISIPSEGTIYWSDIENNDDIFYTLYFSQATVSGTIGYYAYDIKEVKSIIRKVDITSENIQPMLYKKNESIVKDEFDEDGNTRWALVYDKVNDNLFRGRLYADKPNTAGNEVVVDTYDFGEATAYQEFTTSEIENLLTKYGGTDCKAMDIKSVVASVKIPQPPYYWGWGYQAANQGLRVVFLNANNSILGDYDYAGENIINHNSGIQAGYHIFMNSSQFCVVKNYDAYNADITKSATSYAKVRFYNSFNANFAWGSSNTIPFHNTGAWGWDAGNGNSHWVELNITGSANIYAQSLRTLDRGLTTISKAVMLPYAPCKKNGIISDFWEKTTIGTSTNKYLQQKTTGYNDSWYKQFTNLGDDSFTNSTVIKNFNVNSLRDNIYESKLYHSDFYNENFVYDSFRYTFRYEGNYLQPKKLNIIFAGDVLGSDSFMFRFMNYANLLETEDFGDTLVINRNNRLTLTTDEYQNYIRTGYNYDVKSKNQSTAMSWVGTGISAATLAAGVALTASGYGSGAGVPLMITGGLGLAGSIAGSINTTVQNEQSFAQKQQDLKNKSANIATADSVGLMRYYSGEKAKLITYQCSDRVKEQLADLFYYCGYATNEQKVPTLNNRYWFDYCQADIDFCEHGSLTKEQQDMLREKYAQGITKFHNHNNKWDLEQKLENVEVIFVGE